MFSIESLASLITFSESFVKCIKIYFKMATYAIWFVSADFEIDEVQQQHILASCFWYCTSQIIVNTVGLVLFVVVCFI